MFISIIVAMDENRGIGIGNRLPWRLPDDLKYFKNTTLGHHLVMGRKTFDSLGKPLPGRINIVLTRDPNYNPGGEVVIAHSLGEALTHARSGQERETFICGGGALYRQSLPLAHRLYLTLVHTQTEADVFFPPINPSNWVEQRSSYHPADEKHPYSFSTKLLERKLLA